MISRARKKDPLVRYTPAITWSVIAPCTALGIGMTTQPSRFARTPSYANLIDIAPIQVWGGGYFVVALMMFAWRLLVSRGLEHRRYGVITHTVTAGLVAFWLGAFIVRWQTDVKTTIVNPTMWAILFSLVVRSMWGLDDDDDREPPEPVLPPEPCDRTTFPKLESGDGQ